MLELAFLRRCMLMDKRRTMIWGALALTFAGGASAEEEPATIVARPIGASQPVASPPVASKAERLLSGNYRLVITASADGKPVHELACLTASQRTTLAGVLGEEGKAAFISLNCSISELKGNVMILNHTLDLRVPVLPEDESAESSDGGAAGEAVEFREHSVSGSLLVMPNASYPLLTAGGMTYTLQVLPPQ